MKLSLCITTFNRAEMCIESFRDVIDDERIDEIVIIDDHSTDDSFRRLYDHFCVNQKVSLFKQSVNRGMSVNKQSAIYFAKNEWCILFDDDNKLDKSYLDSLFEVLDESSVESEIFMPARAMPNFIYDDFAGESMHRSNIQVYVNKPLFGAMMNTCNYVVNRSFYLRTWQHNPEMKGTDTAWYNYLHLKNDGSFFVVPYMRYEHRVHAESGWMKDAHYNMAKGKEIENLIKAL